MESADKMNQTHIPCASGNNAHTDLLIRRMGDRIHILAHPEMRLTVDAAQDAINALQSFVDAMKSPGDTAVLAVREKLLNRQGRIHRHTDRLDFRDSIQAAQNQAMDLAIALQRTLTAETMRMDDGK
jgi:quinolinate synthase